MAHVHYRAFKEPKALTWNLLFVHSTMWSTSCAATAAQGRSNGSLAINRCHHPTLTRIPTRQCISVFWCQGSSEKEVKIPVVNASRWFGADNLQNRFPDLWSSAEVQSGRAPPRLLGPAAAQWSECKWNWCSLMETLPALAFLRGVCCRADKLMQSHH